MLNPCGPLLNTSETFVCPRDREGIRDIISSVKAVVGGCLEFQVLGWWDQGAYEVLVPLGSYKYGNIHRYQYLSLFRTTPLPTPSLHWGQSSSTQYGVQGRDLLPPHSMSHRPVASHAQPASQPLPSKYYYSVERH